MILPPARSDSVSDNDWRDGLATPAQQLSARKAERHALLTSSAKDLHQSQGEVDDTAKAYRQGRGRAAPAPESGSGGGMLWLAVNAPEEQPVFLPVLASSPQPSSSRRISFADDTTVPGLESSMTYPRSSSSDDYEEDDASLERMASSFSSGSALFPVGDSLDSPSLPTSPLKTRTTSFLTIRDLPTGDSIDSPLNEEPEGEDLSLSQHEAMLSSLRAMKEEEMAARLSGRYLKRGDDPFAELRNAVQDMHEDSQEKAEDELHEYDFMNEMLQRLNDGSW